MNELYTSLGAQGKCAGDRVELKQVCWSFTGCLPLPDTPPTLCEISGGSSQDVSNLSATQWTLEATSRFYHPFRGTSNHPFFDCNESLKSTAVAPPVSSTSQRLKSHMRRSADLAAGLLAASYTYPASPTISASETQMGPRHGATMPHPSRRSGAVSASKAAENAAQESWKRNSTRHVLPAPKAVKRKKSPRRNVFCPPDVLCTAPPAPTHVKTTTAMESATAPVRRSSAQRPVSGSVSQTIRGGTAAVRGGLFGGLSGALGGWQSKGGNKDASAGINKGNSASMRVQSSFAEEYQSTGIKGRKLQFLQGIRHHIMHGQHAPVYTAELSEGCTRAVQSDRVKGSSNSNRLVRKTHARDVLPPMVAGAVPQRFSEKFNSHSASNSSLGGFWRKPLRRIGLQRQQSKHKQHAHVSDHKHTITQERASPVRGAVQTSPQLELKSASTSHDPEEAMYSQKSRASLVGLERTSSDDATHVDHGLQEPAAMSNKPADVQELAAACMPEKDDVMSHKTQCAARKSHSEACSVQHEPSKHAVADRVRSKDCVHSTQQAAPSRQSRSSLELAAGWKSLYLARRTLSENTDLGKEEDHSDFARACLEAGRYRRMQANFRACVYPLHESP